MSGELLVVILVLIGLLAVGGTYLIYKMAKNHTIDEPWMGLVGVGLGALSLIVAAIAAFAVINSTQDYNDCKKMAVQEINSSELSEAAKVLALRESC